MSGLILGHHQASKHLQEEASLKLSRILYPFDRNKDIFFITNLFVLTVSIIIVLLI
jgi:hypothetical protein